MFPRDRAAVAIKHNVGGVRVIWINYSSRDVSIGHAWSGHVGQRVTSGDRRKHLHGVSAGHGDLSVVEPNDADVVMGL